MQAAAHLKFLGPLLCRQTKQKSNENDAEMAIYND